MEMTHPENKTWDPDDRGSDEPNAYICSLLMALATDNVNGGVKESCYEDNQSRTELDTHANMSVVGWNVLIVADAGKTIDVNPFTPDYPSMTVRLVDAAVRYDCPFTGTEYLLLIRNALYVPSM